ARPLLGMLGTAPARAVRRDVGLGTLRKRLRPLRRARRRPRRQRIDASMQLFTRRARQLTRLRQAYRVARPQPHHPGPAVALVTEDPRTALLQIQPAAVAQPALARALNLQLA